MNNGETVDTRAVIQHLLKNVRWTASRSSGPGGQRRDKVSTRAELTLDEDALVGLDGAVAERLRQSLGLDQQPIRIVNQDERLLSRNQDAAALRLAELVGAALAPTPRARRRARPSRASKERRLSDKSQRGDVKRLRRQPPEST